VDKIDKWYKQDFEKKKAEYFKKYAKECELANQRMSGNKNKYGN
jgi:beta-lactamase class D